MKARLYHDTRKKFRDYIDAWSMYFPYPKWMREKYKVRGCYLGCSPTEDGMIRCTWEYDEIGGVTHFGKKIDPKTTPRAFQKIFSRLEKLWNEAVTKNTDKAWEKWNLA